MSSERDFATYYLRSSFWIFYIYLTHLPLHLYFIHRDVDVKIFFFYFFYLFLITNLIIIILNLRNNLLRCINPWNVVFYRADVKVYRKVYVVVVFVNTLIRIVIPLQSSQPTLNESPSIDPYLISTKFPNSFPQLLFFFY